MASAPKTDNQQAKTQANKQAAGITAAHFIIGIIISVVASAVFAFIWDQVKDRSRDTTALDHALLFWMYHHRAPWLTSLATVLAWMGSPPVIVGIGAVAAVVGLFWRKVRGAAWTLPIAVIGAGVIIQGIKITFRRPRPSFFTPLLHESGYSFPSGHSLISIVVYGLLGYFIMHLFRRHGPRIGVGVLTMLLVLLIGVSRVYVGVHYPTDVLAGWTIGLPWLLTCIWLHEVLSRRFHKAGEPVLDKPPPDDKAWPPAPSGGHPSA